MAGFVGASFRFVLFTFPLVVDFNVVVVVIRFDMWGPWREVVGRVCQMGKAAALLLVPNCLAGKDGSVPMTVPWELGSASRWDTHGWVVATPQVSITLWRAWMVL